MRRAARGRAQAFRPDSVVNISGMSFGSLSDHAKVALAKGAELAGTGICSGEGGMISVLTPLKAQRKILIHINNTNPMLLEDAPERALVEQAGLRVGVDGMRFTL